MRRRLLLLIFLFITAIEPTRPTAPGRPTGPTDPRETISIDGFERTYLLHVPPKTHNKLPVVMILHGRGATSESAANDFGWTEKADQSGFIAVFAGFAL